MSLIDNIDIDFDLKKPSEPTEPSLDEQMTRQGNNQNQDTIPDKLVAARQEQKQHATEPTRLGIKEDDANHQVRKKISQEIFARTGKKVVIEDPMIEVIMVWRELNEEWLEYVSNALEASSGEILDNLVLNQDKVLANFDEKLNELKDTLTRLENQKEAIVADVWGKMQARVTKQIEEQLSRDLKTIAKNTNNQVNNQCNILMGGLGGLLVGLILCAIIVMVLR